MAKIKGIARTFLWAMIISFTIAGLLGAGVFLFGAFNQTMGKILLTIVILGTFNLLALVNSRTFKAKDFTKITGHLGVILAGISAILFLGWVWEFIDITVNTGKAILIATIFTVSLAQVSIIVGSLKKPAVKILFYSTVVLIVGVSGILVHGIITEFQGYTETIFRIFGFFAVLDVLGLILTPLVRKLS